MKNYSLMKFSNHFLPFFFGWRLLFSRPIVSVGFHLIRTLSLERFSLSSDSVSCTEQTFGPTISYGQFRIGSHLKLFFLSSLFIYIFLWSRTCIRTRWKFSLPQKNKNVFLLRIKQTWMKREKKTHDGRRESTKSVPKQLARFYFAFLNQIIYHENLFM